jgi:hypothetical protein
MTVPPSLRRILPAALGLGASAAIALAPWTVASAAPTNVVVNGHCTGTSVDNLQVQREDTGKLSIDFGVDMARHVKGVAWSVHETDNGTAFVSKTVYTLSDGSFSITRAITPSSGSNTIVGTATNPKSGESCTLSATV